MSRKPEKDLENGHTPQADFDRNREGLYGGLPQARDSQARDPKAEDPAPRPPQPR